MQQFTALFYIGAMLLFGLLFGRLVKLLKFPNVTGYLLSGLLLGPYILNFFGTELIEQSAIISEMALAFIAFTIGCEFKRSFFKKVGMIPIVIALFEALVAVFFVGIALILTGNDVAFSIILGAIAAATAPASTVMVIKQYRAKGPVTDMLMSVVALDDAIALIGFAIATALAKSLSGNGSVHVLSSILLSCIEIGAALLIGILFGLLMCILMKYFRKNSNRLVISVATIFIASAVCTTFNLSALLTCMMCGMTVCNLSDSGNEIVSLLDTATPPIYVLFFVISGACLNINLIPQIGIVGLIYIITRVVGKLTGAAVGARLMKVDDNIRKYLGPTLIPQAGVAIGLTVIAQSTIPQYASQVRTIVLCATMIYELFGPIIAKMALKRAGEIELS